MKINKCFFSSLLLLALFGFTKNIFGRGPYATYFFVNKSDEWRMVAIKNSNNDYYHAFFDTDQNGKIKTKDAEALYQGGYASLMNATNNSVEISKEVFLGIGDYTVYMRFLKEDPSIYDKSGPIVRGLNIWNMDELYQELEQSEYEMLRSPADFLFEIISEGLKKNYKDENTRPDLCKNIEKIRRRLNIYGSEKLNKERQYLPGEMKIEKAAEQKIELREKGQSIKPLESKKIEKPIEQKEIGQKKLFFEEKKKEEKSEKIESSENKLKESAKLTMFKMAKENNIEDLKKLFKQHVFLTKEIDSTDDLGNTIIYYAIKQSSPEMVNAILEYSPNLDIPNKKEVTARELAMTLKDENDESLYIADRVMLFGLD